MNLWPVEHFFPPFFSRLALIWKKTGEKSVQLVRGSFFRKYFLWNPYFINSNDTKNRSKNLQKDEIFTARVVRRWAGKLENGLGFR